MTGTDEMITLTEFKKNMNKYIAMSSKKDIYLTSYGKIVAKLTSPFQDRIKLAESLFGVIDDALSAEDARKERLYRK
ncbi:MAG: type II toxin-antitoxin system prevent-host-death family antitoxin [Solobacterium sp.]|nr:type II toxin-antitoxin system prevent-host-death family antitoxin [Solobacterium sp.]